MELNRFKELRAFVEQIRSCSDNASQLDPTTAKQLEQHIDTLGEHSIAPLLRMFQQDTQRPCCRELLLYAAQEPLLNERILSGLRRIVGKVERPCADDFQVAALSLLHQIIGLRDFKHSPTTFADPQQVMRQAARSFASQIDSPAEIARAAQLMMKQLPHCELISMLELMLEELPSAAQQLCEEFAARLDLDLSIRTEIRRLTSCHPIALAVRDPNVVSACKTAPLCWQILLPAQASAAIMILVHCPQQARYAQYAIDDRSVLIQTHYERHKAPALAATTLMLRESISFARAREIVAGAARNAVRLGIPLTDDYYLCRDLLMLDQQHRQASSSNANHAYVASHATDLLACGEAQKAYEVLRHYLQQHPSSATANSDLALAYGMSCLAMEQFATAQTMLTIACQQPDTTIDHWWNLACASERNQDLSAMKTALAHYIETAAKLPLPSSETAQRLELARALLGCGAPTPTPPPRSRSRGRSSRISSKPSRNRTGPVLRPPRSERPLVRSISEPRSERPLVRSISEPRSERPLVRSISEPRSERPLVRSISEPRSERPLVRSISGPQASDVRKSVR